MSETSSSLEDAAESIQGPCPGTSMRIDSNPTRSKYQNAVAVGLVVLAMGLCAACAQYKASTLLGVLASRFALDAAGSSWIMSVFTLAGIFFALPAGGMTQRFGFKKVMLGSAGLIILGSLIGLFSGNNGVALIASRAIEGISLTFITTCAPVAIERCVDPRKVALATGIWGCWGSGGAVIASLLTPHLFAAAGFEGVWIFFAVATLFSALLLLFCLHDPGTPDVGSLEAAAMTKTSYKDILTKNTALYLLAFAAFNIVMLAILGMLPSVLQLPQKGFSIGESGFASTFPSLLALISTPLFGAIANKTGRIKPLLILTMLMLGPCVFVLYTQVGAAFWIASVVLGLIGFGCVGLLIAGWMEVIPRPELVPKAMGVFTLVQCIGQFLGTFLIQLLLGNSLDQWMLAGVVLCGIALAGVACIALVDFR